MLLSIINSTVYSQLDYGLIEIESSAEAELIKVFNYVLSESYTCTDLTNQRAASLGLSVVLTPRGFPANGNIGIECKV
jgi:hypothetical protein